MGTPLSYLQLNPQETQEVQGAALGVPQHLLELVIHHQLRHPRETPEELVLQPQFLVLVVEEVLAALEEMPHQLSMEQQAQELQVHSMEPLELTLPAALEEQDQHQQTTVVAAVAQVLDKPALSYSNIL